MDAMELKELAEEHDLAHPGRAFVDLADARDYVCAQLDLDAADAGEDEDDDEDEEEKEKKHTENEDDEEDEDEEADEERLGNLDAELGRCSSTTRRRTARCWRPHGEFGRDIAAFASRICVPLEAWQGAA